MTVGRDAALAPALRLSCIGAAALCVLPLLLQLPPRIALLVAGAGLGVTMVSWRRPLPWPLRLLLLAGVLGLVLLQTRVALGRDTGCAVLAAMLAIKPSETFVLREARSLLGFALFAPFSTFLLDQGPVSLVLGLAGTFAVLVAMYRLADFESALASTVAWHDIAGVLRLIAIGLPLALAVFWLFPRMSSPLWGVPGRAVARPGLSDTMTPGEWIDLIGDDTPALRVKFFGPTPAQHQMYWRGPVLQDYDGRTWRRSGWTAAGAPAPVRRSRVVWDYQIEIEPTDRRLLVALELPMQPPAGTLLAHDFSLSGMRPLDGVGRWRMRSAPPVFFEPELSRLQRASALRLPDGFNPRAVAMARQWRREAGADDAAIVQRALRMIRTEFAYTLTTPLPGRHAVDEFVFDYKAGFCEHFSSAFVVLMRAAGIPARVVTGFVGGYRNPLGDYWLVRRSDAHAWAEVWLPQRGWTRVDPTAAVAPERIYDTLADRTPGALGGLAGLTPLFNVGDWMRRGWNDFVLGFDATRQQRLLQPLGLRDLTTSGLAALFTLAGGIALGWMLWLSARGERERDPLLRAWHGLGRRYARIGLARAPHEPAGQWAARLAAAAPDRHAALSSITRRFVQWRYASTVAENAATTRLRKQQLVRDLRAHRPDQGKGTAS